MNKNFANPLRFWTVGLVLLSILAGFLIGTLNAPSISLVYIVLFLAVAATGLFVNQWAGFAASVVAVFALILLNQFVGIYPVQDGWVNIAGELAVFLSAGPLAGSLSRLIEGGQAQAEQWAALAQSRQVHDESFQTLKPQWALARVQEEILRAKEYARPLSLGVLQWVPAENISAPERLAGLQSLIRIARACTNSADVVAYHGDNRVLALLPERSAQDAQKVLTQIEARATREMAIPNGGVGLGSPLAKLGRIIFASATLGADVQSADAFIDSAVQALGTK